MVPRPWLLYKLFLLLIALVCGALLSQGFSTTAEARPDMRFYWALHYWECAFDAVSAATGSGLTTLQWPRDLTPAGQWIVLGTGLLTAVGYLALLFWALAASSGRPTAHLGRMILLSGGWYLAAAVAIWIAAPSSDADSILQSPWTVLFSLGTCRLAQADAVVPWAAFAAGLGGVGVFVLLMVAPSPALGIKRRAALVTVLSYGLLVALLALLIAAFEMRRGSDVERPFGRGGSSPAEMAQHSEAIVAASAILAAQAGGTAIDPPSGVPRRDATRFVLGLGILLGGLFGAPGGGVLVPTSLALAYWLSRNRAAAALWGMIARRTALFAFVATVVVALGLLLIEQKTASAFSPIPTFADAWLDAASAIGGANLTGELTSAVTNRSLSSGIRTPSDQYQYGMLWLMAAMLIGRLAPAWFICSGLRTVGRTGASRS